MVGYAFCASFCTHSASVKILERLVSMGEDVVPIISERSAVTDTRFGKAQDFLTRVEDICSRRAVLTVEEAEHFGAVAPLDALVISPCTGNTLAKIACGISDSVVSLAAKAHLRCDRPLLISLASNDAMSQNLKNIAAMLTRKSVYFVPLVQDDPQKKPHSLVADTSLFFESYDAMRNSRQLRPLFLTR